VTIILNYMSKATITKITKFQNCIVARAHNRRIIYTPQEDGSMIIELVRILSKEDQERFKNAEPEGNQHIVRGKIFVTSLLFTPETFENLRVFMNVVADIDSEIYTKPVTV
jgi:hypothetical protein